MRTRSTILLTIFVLLLAKVQASPLRNCYASNVQLNSNQMVTVNSPNYPSGFYVPSGCQFTIVAPIYHSIEFMCFFYIGDGQSYCDPRDSFWYQSNGTPKLDGARQYCGSNQMLQDRTPYNSLTMGYTSTNSSGIYTCNFTAKPTKCDCGQRTTTRIVGGEMAAPNAYPYMAVLLDAGTTSSVRGGATIISTTAAITACHVFMRNGKFVEPDDVLISVGRSDLSKDVNSDTPYSATYEVGEIIRHPQYDLDESLNDIAVIKTKFFILFNRGVGVACLPAFNEPTTINDGKKIIEMGFGTTDYGGAYSKQLKAASATVFPNVECKGTFDELTDNDMCTTTFQKDRNDTCQGDSGGPIILPAFRDFLVGIVKDGIYCGGPYPGKCQRVSPFRKWIQSVAGEMNFFCLYS